MRIDWNAALLDGNRRQGMNCTPARRIGRRLVTSCLTSSRDGRYKFQSQPAFPIHHHDFADRGQRMTR